MIHQRFSGRPNFEVVEAGEAVPFTGNGPEHVQGVYCLLTNEDRREERRSLGVGRYIGDLLNPAGEGFIPVFEVDDPASPTGQVELLGAECWIKTLTEGDMALLAATLESHPPISALDYASTQPDKF